jgi:hypothetical protein
MAFDPMSAGMSAAGLLAGFLGGGNELTPEMRRLLEQYQRLFHEQRAYGKGIPGSDTQEQAALAQAKALAGSDASNQQDSLLAALGTNNPNAGVGLANFKSGVAGNMAGLDYQALLDSLSRRQNAKWGGALSALNGAMGAASGPRTSNELSGLLMQLGQTWGASRYKAPTPFNFGTAPATPWNTSGGFGGGGGGAEPGGGGVSYGSGNYDSENPSYGPGNRYNYLGGDYYNPVTG